MECTHSSPVLWTHPSTAVNPARAAQWEVSECFDRLQQPPSIRTCTLTLYFKPFPFQRALPSRTQKNTTLSMYIFNAPLFIIQIFWNLLTYWGFSLWHFSLLQHDKRSDWEIQLSLKRCWPTIYTALLLCVSLSLSGSCCCNFLLKPQMATTL
jgi:hypothetical protein